MHRFVRVAAFALVSSAFALSACSPPPATDKCGDGVVTGAEACDDGNGDNGDGCEADCTATGGGAVCGNGQLETGELCDDGNTTNGDGCESSCVITGVGGGAGGGGGDDGGQGGGGGGTPSVCGNGTREGTELCDDGNQDATDSCKNDCSLRAPGAWCGNGTVESPEICDDGNLTPNDGCEVDCTQTVAATSASVCGDGTRQTPELCDDGNISPGDGCEPDCTKTTVAEIICPAAAVPAPTSGGCDAVAGDSGRLIIGTVLLPGRVLKGGQVLVGSDGNIACVSCDCSATSGFATAARLFCGANVVSPGLINSHDHITYPAAPAVAVGVPDGGQLLIDGGIPERYEHRHDWRQGNNGHTVVSNGGNGSNAQIKWNELRQLLAGTTSVSGSGGAPGLLRNLDAPNTSATGDSQLGLGANTTGAYYQTFPLRDTPNIERVGSCAYGAGRDDPTDIPANAAYLPHISEGIEESAHNEFLCMSGLQDGGFDMLSDRTAIIHGIAIKPAEIRLMASRGSSLIWSPRSNVVLYGETAPMGVYARSRTNIALGTDWVRSGSMNILRELQCADYLNSSFYNRLFSSETLWRMVTVHGARAGFVHNRAGVLASGMVADISIFKYGSGNPYRAVITSHPKDVLLTMRGGKALYGDANVVSALGGTCDALTVCSVNKSVCLSGEVSESLSQLTALNASTYPLFFCGEDPHNEPTCTPMRGAPWLFSGANPYTGVPSGADTDGDGIADTSDLCSNVFNPKRPMDRGSQADADADGTGDVCDICPLNASTTTCSAFSATDIDGDGAANTADNCPAEPNSSQADADSDQKGDACDECPNASNPGVQECPGTPVTIYQAKAPNSAFIGQKVSLSNVLVTATEPNGFVLQVHESETGYTTRDYSGIYVFYPAPSGSPVPRVDIKVGDRVNIPNATVALFPSAATLKQQQLGSIVGGSVSVASSNNALPAPEVATVAELATGGAKSATLEAVLVRVNNVTVANIAPTPAGGEVAPTYEFTVTQSSGGPELRIDDLIHLVSPFPAANETFNFLQGPLLARRENTKIEPRSSLDYGRPPAVLSFGPAGQFVRVGTAQNPTIPTAIKVRLNTLQPTDTTVDLTSDATVSVPATLTVPAGQIEVVVPVQGITATATASATISAKVGGQTPVTTTVRVLDGTETPVIASLTPNPAAVVPSGTVPMTVTLDIPPAANTNITMSVSPGTTFGTTPGTVTVNADTLSTTFNFAADASASGSGSVTATLGSSTRTATVNVVSNTATGLVINEIDYDQVDADTAEFVEIFNPTANAISLAGLELVFVNGSNVAAAEYFPSGVANQRVALSAAGATLAPNEYLVVRTAAVVVPAGTKTIDLPPGTGGWMQNGLADAVGIYNTANGSLVDSISYEDASTAGVTLSGLVYREGASSTAALADTNGTPLQSIARKVNGVDTNSNAADFQLTTTITPGAANP